MLENFPKKFKIKPQKNQRNLQVFNYLTEKKNIKNHKIQSVKKACNNQEKKPSIDTDSEMRNIMKLAACLYCSKRQKKAKQNKVQRLKDKKL